MDYVQCIADENGNCTTPGHKKGRIRSGTGTCRIGRAWKRDAEPCFMCGDLVPHHLGYRSNPDFIIAINIGDEEVVVDLDESVADEVLDALMRGGIVLCDECAESIESAIKPDEGHVGQVSVDGIWYSVIVLVSDLPNPTVRKQDGIREIFRRIRSGERFHRPVTKWRDGEKVTECIVHAVDESACMCEDPFHRWNELHALVHNDFAFGFGHKCADFATREGGVEFNGMMSEAVPELVAKKYGAQQTPPPRGNRWNKAIDLVRALRSGQRIKPSAKKEIDGKLKTECVIHANGIECETGYENWEDMPAIKRGNRVHGFCQSCAHELRLEGVIFDGALAELVRDLQKARRRSGRTPDHIRESMDYGPARARNGRK